MNLRQITPVIITYNEEPNITRTLDHLSWAHRIVVVDSYSTDRTVEILKANPQVNLFQREFDDMASQWNYAIAHAETDWALSCDADYLITTELQEEITHLPEEPPYDSYFIPFRYCISGKPLRGTILPPRCALFRKSCAEYVNDGHTQLLVPQGESGTLLSPIFHDDRKPLSRWFQNQLHYMDLEAEKLSETPPGELELADRIRCWLLVAPLLVFFYCLIPKGGILDGWRGVYYALQRMVAELVLSFKLVQRRFFS